MISTDLQAQLQLLLKVSAPPLIEVSPTQAIAAAAHWVPGQRLQGEVQASLPNGRFQVLVGDAVLDMNLPQETRLGDKLDLTLLTLQPRLTFALSHDVAGQTQVNLSSAARFFGALLEKAVQAPSAPVTTSVPLLAAAPSNGKELALALRQTLAQSGLFYEAHQAQWVNGQKPLPELLQEPQAKLPPLPPRSGELPSVLPSNKPAMGNRGETMALAASMAKLPAGEMLPAAAGALPGVAAQPLLAAEPLHPQSLPLVQQQLQVLDNQQILWQGQVWPGQQMDWRIEERAAQATAAAEQSDWYSRLDLELPQLGKVSVLLALHGGELRVNLKAAQPQTLAALNAGQDTLRTALETAGIPGALTTVERDEHA